MIFASGRRWLIILLIAAASTTGPRAWAGDLNHLDVNDVVSMESAGDFAVSPDGEWVVWVKTTPDHAKNKRAQNVYLTKVNEELTIQLTRGDGDRSPRFSPDGRRLGFLGQRGEKSKTQIYLLDLRGGEARKITSCEFGVNAFDWLDNDTFVFSTREDSTLRERTLKQKKDDTIVVADREHYAPVRLFKQKMEDGQPKRLTANQGVVTEFAVSPLGKWIVTNENQDVDYRYDNLNPPKQFLIDTATSKRREICSDPHVDPYDFEWDAGEKGFYCRRKVASDSTDTYVGISELYYYSVERGRLGRVDLGWDHGLGRGYRAVKDGVVAALAGGATDRVVHARAQGGGKYKLDILDFEQPVRLAGAARNGNRIVYFSSGASTIPEVKTAVVDNGRLKNARNLTGLNEPLKKKTLSRSEIVRWTGALGDTVEGVLYYPAAYSDTTKYPLVCLLHGGPSGVDPDFFTERWSNYPHVLASRGTFVFKVNYHGSGNYGLRWVESIKGHYYEYEVPDIMSGIDGLIARGLVDDTRLGIMGWSNGAILAIACCVESDRFKVLCAGAGDVNWTSDFGNCAFGAGFDNAYFGGPPWENVQTYVDKSPLFRMQQLKTPTLIIFGSEDRSVPTEQGWEHFRAMRAIGAAPVRFLLFPGAGHGLTKLSHQKRKMEEELAWFDTYLFDVKDQKNEAFNDNSRLALELDKNKVARVGHAFGQEANGNVVPEIVEFEGLRVGRFEVTRVQFSAFDPNYTYPPGTDNYPVNQVSIPIAQAYCIWLGEQTGRKYRLPRADEMNKLLEAARPNVKNENNLENWLGMSPTPDELIDITEKIEELEEYRLLIEPVGSFRPAGAAGVYDLGGNVAEWVTDQKGSGKIMGLSAVSIRDARVEYTRPPLSYVGFRVIEE